MLPVAKNTKIAAAENKVVYQVVELDQLKLDLQAYEPQLAEVRDSLDLDNKENKVSVTYNCKVKGFKYKVNNINCN